MVSPLPPELLLRVIELVLEQTPRHPISLLLVNSHFHDLCQSVLHTVLRFSSIRQLDCFAQTCNSLVFHPRVLSTNLPGGIANPRLFELVRNCLLRIAEIAPKSSQSGRHKLEFQRIQLCLNSHTFNSSKHLFEALDLTNPDEFIWTGPDPAHHFSIAIVPNAAVYLFKAMHTWTNLRYLKLTNLSFPRSEDGHSTLLLAKALGVILSANGAPPHDHSPISTDVIIFSSSPPMPRLQTIYLGQITFLDPLEVAVIVCANGLASLTSVRIVDAYQGSIWGPRIRNADVERAAMHYFRSPSPVMDDLARGSCRTCVDRVKRLVSCEALTERIMGGDRMDYDN